MRSLDEYAKIAEQVNQEAAEFLLHRFGDIKSMSQKDVKHFSIEEDKQSDDLYCQRLKALSPEVALYTEEGEKQLDAEYVWVVDPIEGTSNYRVGNPFWATQIGLLKAGQPVVGVINAPAMGEFFVAIAGQGTRLNGQKIKVGQETVLDRAMATIGKGTSIEHFSWWTAAVKQLTPALRTVRLFGSTGLELAYLAAGRLDLQINGGSDLYDYAPGVLVVREAGGKVVNFEGEDWQLDDEQLIAGNPQLVDQVLPLV